MMDARQSASLLADLELRQDDVLKRLDDLNQRLERTLLECMGGRPGQDPIAAELN